MPQLRIPALGEVVTLAEDWTFGLFAERRNEKLIELLGANYRYPHTAYHESGDGRSWWALTAAERQNYWDKSKWVDPLTGATPVNMRGTGTNGEVMVLLTFREGTELKFDRYYIRQGGANFDSVTFRSNCVVCAPEDPLFKVARRMKSIRFWTKLGDVNTMVVK